MVVCSVPSTPFLQGPTSTAVSGTRNTQLRIAHFQGEPNHTRDHYPCTVAINQICKQICGI